MNPFIAFLILVPLLLSLAFWGFTLVFTIRDGLTGSMIAMHIIFGGLSAALVYLLVRSSRGRLLDDEPIRHLDVGHRKILTNSMLTITYVVVIGGLALVTNLQSARNWIGVVSVVMALSMFISAVREMLQARRLAVTDRIDPSAVEPVPLENHRSKYWKTTNRIFFSSILTALSWIFLFLNYDGSRYISNFDFIGLLTLLISVNVWFFATGKALSIKQ